MEKYKNAMNEVLQIIDLLSEENKNKISKQVIEYFRKNQSTVNKITINPDIPLYKQKISYEAKVLLKFVSTYL